MIMLPDRLIDARLHRVHIYLVEEPSSTSFRSMSELTAGRSDPEENTSLIGGCYRLFQGFDLHSEVFDF